VKARKIGINKYVVCQKLEGISVASYKAVNKYKTRGKH
jgi:hypothetical protein